ncbi:unnamed protein product [Candida verbasci]|uniref:Shr3 amino acid permease chaperone n=1 Tax=Candida verbasci TaxID=1227364 RepID=A0A9W4TZI8_9ASCO|nr:unnamed protein product [Candida verbasci]
MMKYKDLVPIGTTLIIASTCFGLGAIYGNLPYDIHTLWLHSDEQSFVNSLNHYKQWGESPMYTHYILHFIGLLGLIGHFIKLYKPEEDAKYFEYGSLGLFMIGVIIYLTNLRTGINSCISGEWGEVDSATGINVIAASQVMIIFVLFGVLLLQGGLYYAQWYDEKLKSEFYAKEAEEAANAAKQQEVDEVKAKGNKEKIIDDDIEIISETAKPKKKTTKKRKS